MSDFAVVAVRGPLVESLHRVSVSVTRADGEQVAWAGDPAQVTFWRSAAKPFQLLPLVEDGGISAFGLDRAMLALACGSHNAEPIHREVGARWLAALGLQESDLACGGHPSLWPALADQMIHDDVVATPLWSNCSGKHSSLLALARLHGWPTAGYEEAGHPVQQRVAATIAEWSGLSPAALQWGVDGCTAAAVALSLQGMSVAYARLATSELPAMRTIREAMMGEPHLVAGTDRLDTILMQAWPGRVIAKIGAEGVYSAALPELGLGIALKVEDGDMKSAGIALVAVLDFVTTTFGSHLMWPGDALQPWREPPIRNTRREPTGLYGTIGGLRLA
ncbi:MAG: asparaginase [Gemmatimonadales bacterium]